MASKQKELDLKQMARIRRKMQQKTESRILTNTESLGNSFAQDFIYKKKLSLLKDSVVRRLKRRILRKEIMYFQQKSQHLGGSSYFMSGHRLSL